MKIKMKLVANVLIGSALTLAACSTTAQAAVLLSDLNNVGLDFTYGTFVGQTTVNPTFYRVAGTADQFGGAGSNFSPSRNISAEPFLEVSARIGSNNANAAFNVLLEDADGTQVGYAFPATLFNTSTFTNAYALIAMPSFTNVPGITPGLNTSAITQFQLQGTFSQGPSLLFSFDFDNVAAVAVVPEPATIGLLGVISMMLITRRRVEVL